MSTYILLLDKDDCVRSSTLDSIIRPMFISISLSQNILQLLTRRRRLPIYTLEHGRSSPSLTKWPILPDTSGTRCQGKFIGCDQLFPFWRTPLGALPRHNVHEIHGIDLF